MRVCIQHTGHPPVIVEVSRGGAVVCLKTSVEVSIGASVAQQSLRFGGVMLMDGKRLSSYGVRDGSHVFLVLQLIGGSVHSHCAHLLQTRGCQLQIRRDPVTSTLIDVAFITPQKMV